MSRPRKVLAASAASAGTPWIAVLGLGVPDSDTDSIVTSMTELDGVYTLTYDTNIADRSALGSWAHWWISEFVSGFASVISEQLEIKVTIEAAASARDGGPSLCAGIKKGGENVTAAQWLDNMSGLVVFDTGGNEIIGGTMDASASASGTDSGGNPAAVSFILKPYSSTDGRSTNSAIAWNGSDVATFMSGIREVGFDAADIATHGTEGSGHLSFHFSRPNTPGVGSGTIQFRLDYRHVVVGAP